MGIAESGIAAQRQNMDDTQLLAAALHEYGLDGAQISILRSLNNRIYRVDASNGVSYSLRICASFLAEQHALADELQFLAFLASHSNVIAPKPIPNSEGSLLTALPTPSGERLSCLFEWIAGEEASKNLSVPVLHAIGVAVAQLHQAGRSFPFPSPEHHFRAGYHYDAALLRLHHSWIHEHRAEIGPEHTVLLHHAVDQALAEYERIGETRENFGVIHSDLHFGNFLVHTGRIAVIDFSDVGRGHYLFDLATILGELKDDPEQCAERWQAFLAGYRTIAPLPYQNEHELDMFMVASNLIFLDWVYNSPASEVRAQKMRWVPAVIEAIRGLTTPVG
jgi:Ser/Thr protein kinase RdoA (MazF antagonist)